MRCDVGGSDTAATGDAGGVWRHYVCRAQVLGLSVLSPLYFCFPGHLSLDYRTPTLNLNLNQCQAAWARAEDRPIG